MKRGRISDYDGKDFDGESFDEPRDGDRLRKQFNDVWNVMKDEQWHTSREIALLSGHDWSAASARVRDCRKPRFGGHTVDSEYVRRGLWKYKLTINRKRPEPATSPDPSPESWQMATQPTLL